ncbi:MAG TPA: phenylacetate--CoA ligase family protein [Polyangiaceae bacterium]|nr:phenylacetate--CoA ligase family protein [Polyangiaceae bacterium]
MTSQRTKQAERVLTEFSHFFDRAPVAADPALADAPVTDGAGVLSLFERMRTRVPAYRHFLEEHGCTETELAELEDLRKLPVCTKQNYHRAYPLPALCWDGRLEACDMLAVSSGSTGEPTVWPRSVTDELGTTERFEQVLVSGFNADRRPTLAVVCFALGSWVGGMYTTAACRHLAAKGYPITVVTPGNNPSEILRIVAAIGHMFEQVVLLGYPPFVKDVVDAGCARGLDWPRYRVKLVLAGEVFSEAWRELVCERLGESEPWLATASLYGTADGGVLANETPLSIQIRHALSEHPALARELFGEPRLPTLCQYDPRHRYFEVVDGQLLFSGDGGAPLMRYNILDRGGVITYAEMRAFLDANGLGSKLPQRGTPLPFVYVFGRTNFAVSYYGANVYPENVAIGLEQPEFADHVTGKFVLEVVEDAALNARLKLSVELVAGAAADLDDLARRLQTSVVRQLCSVNSEFANYVPVAAREPEINLLPLGDPNYFPPGVKHRYTRH